MTVLQRLLKYPHSAVFDKDAHAEPVLQIRGGPGTTWNIADEVLTIVSGDATFTYDLSQLTLGQLAAALAQDGLEVGELSPAFVGLSATILLEGSGDAAQASSNRLQAFTNLLWSLYAGYAKEIREAGRQVQEALRQMVITQAESEWLDLWGRVYGIGRENGEQDQDYAPRIPQEAFRLRVNALAIEQAVKDATGKVIRIEEPWGTMFRLDESKLSGTNRFYDGSDVGYHLLLPVSETSIDWSDVLPIIERNRPAGVLVLPPETRISSFVDASIDGTIWVNRTDTFGAHAKMAADNRLCYMQLSNEEITRNWEVAITCSNNDFGRLHASFAAITIKGKTDVGRVDVRTLDILQVPYIEGVDSVITHISGINWSEGGGWGPFPWSANQRDLELQIEACERLYDYVHNQLPVDLS